MNAMQSASTYVALLDETNPELQARSLKAIKQVIDQFWPELADHVTKFEDLYETISSPHRGLAAMIASKIYYYLGEYHESRNFALRAGNYFDVTESDSYVQTILSQCIDYYIAKQTSKVDPVDEDAMDTSNDVVAEQLSKIIEAMFDRCLQSKQYTEAIGIALEAHRLDVIERIFEATSQNMDLRTYILETTIKIVDDINFRQEVLRLCLQYFLNPSDPSLHDYPSACKCIILLNDDLQASDLLTKLLTSKDDHLIMMAMQLAFDFQASCSQQFLTNVMERLDQETPELPKIMEILSGAISLKYQLAFLSQKSQSDVGVINKIKNSLESRDSINQSALTFANAFMNAGTLWDQNLQSNSDWLNKVSKWSQFCAVAALGVIHKGNIKQANNLLSKYLPSDATSRSPYSEGGSLFAMGLIHSNHGKDILDFLKEKLKSFDHETIQHGACLGIGVAGMASCNTELYEEVKTILYSDNAVAGEAAGISMGLLMLGNGTQEYFEELITHAHETQHDKILRGIAMGLPLLVYGQQEKADKVIDQLCDDNDHALRYGGMYAIGMAYVGTANNKAIKKLLHFSVTDVNDNIRRAAVTNLGFVLIRDPEALPSIIELLVESYNPHVRYGCAIALGIACAGTGSEKAYKLLKTLSKDNTDFVRQGAMIGLAMVLIQQNQQNPQAVSLRKMLNKVISKKHEDAMAKFGASIASGILDAGGRNVTIQYITPLGSLNMKAIVGTALFAQYWYWFPLTLFLSLSFEPTGIMCLTKNLDPPNFEVVSDAKPSLFAYPPAMKEAKDRKIERISTAILSITAKAKARQRKNEQRERKSETPVASKSETASIKGTSVNGDLIEVDMDSADEKIVKKSTPEPLHEFLQNFSRVCPKQEQYITFKPDSRYKPISIRKKSGIIMVYDNTPDQDEDLIKFPKYEESLSSSDSTNTVENPFAVAEADEDEAPIPEPFEYPFDENGEEELC